MGALGLLPVLWLLAPEAAPRLAFVLLAALAFSVAAALLAGAYFKARIGGYTGDCLGATQQLTELCFFAGGSRCGNTLMQITWSGTLRRSASTASATGGWTLPWMRWTSPEPPPRYSPDTRTSARRGTHLLQPVLSMRGTRAAHCRTARAHAGGGFDRDELRPMAGPRVACDIASGDRCLANDVWGYRPGGGSLSQMVAARWKRCCVAYAGKTAIASSPVTHPA